LKRKILFRIFVAVLSITLAASLTPVICAVQIESVKVTEEENAPMNYAPIAENLNYTTYKGVSINGNFQAVDPEGDMLGFRVVTPPRKGTLQISGGSFVYIPAEGKKGKDSFTYVAIDTAGNISAEAKVNILIEKQSTKITYSDMTGNGSHYSALRLAEKGIFVGEKIGDGYFFNPDRAVTRGEFLTMCISLAGIEPLEDITKTGFADDEEMPLWVKPYVSTALMSGLVKGYETPTGAIVFDAASPITNAEAAVLLDNVLGISDVHVSMVSVEPAVPAWASQAALNLSACNIITPNTITMESAGTYLTRAQAANMLSPAIDFIEAKKSNSSLLSWAW
jgi:hypothetical protein